ncbi:MAG: RnfABCDGE type electron transport complex subunit G [Nitrospirota bacterium]|nr:RnfABCDGE type electron transport complex subunit G [Nitrospirota bacterium]
MGRLIIVLTAICLVATIALARVYDITKGPIAEQERLRTVSAIKAVLPAFNNDIDRDAKEVVVGRDKKDRDIRMKFYTGKRDESPVGMAFQVIAPDGYAGDISVLMGVTPEGEITGIEIISQRETPGLGNKILQEKWRGEFKGRSLEDGPKLAVKKDGGEIDQFSGATISPRAVTNAVKRGLEIYRKEFNHGG